MPISPLSPLTNAVTDYTGCAAWEPGNSTRYELLLVALPENAGRAFFAWVNAPGGGRSMTINVNGGAVTGDYLAEKMGLDFDRREADIAQLLAFLDAQGVRASLPDGWTVNEDGCAVRVRP